MFVYFWFQNEEGEEDMKKGTQLLEIYALEIQMFTAQVRQIFGLIDTLYN